MNGIPKINNNIDIEADLHNIVKTKTIKKVEIITIKRKKKDLINIVEKENLHMKDLKENTMKQKNKKDKAKNI